MGATQKGGVEGGREKGFRRQGGGWAAGGFLFSVEKGTSKKAVQVKGGY